MKKTTFLLFVLLVIGFVFESRGQTRDRLDGAPDTSEYRKLVSKVKGGDVSIDFTKLRAAYLDWINDECNVSEAPDREAMVKAFEAKEYQKAVDLALKVLDYEYVNRGLHTAVSNGYKELGDSERAKFHEQVSAGLMKGALSSGDGKTAKTAYVVLSTREEYVLMRELGYTVSSQALVFDKELGAFDVLSGTDKDGKKGSFYFDINRVWIGSTSSKPCKIKKSE